MPRSLPYAQNLLFHHNSMVFISWTMCLSHCQFYHSVSVIYLYKVIIFCCNKEILLQYSIMLFVLIEGNHFTSSLVIHRCPCIVNVSSNCTTSCQIFLFQAQKWVWCVSIINITKLPSYLGVLLEISEICFQELFQVWNLWPQYFLHITGNEGHHHEKMLAWLKIQQHQHKWSSHWVIKHRNGLFGPTAPCQPSCHIQASPICSCLVLIPLNLSHLWSFPNVF